MLHKEIIGSEYLLDNGTICRVIGYRAISKTYTCIISDLNEDGTETIIGIHHKTFTDLKDQILEYLD